MKNNVQYLQSGDDDLKKALEGRRSNSPIHPGWWAFTAVVLLVIASFIWTVVVNPNMEWDVVAKYFAVPEVLAGLGRTLELTAIAMATGIIGGVLLAVMQTSRVPVLSGGSRTFIWLLRGTPLLVQILFWYNIAALIPTVSLGLPGSDPWFSIDTNVIVTPYLAAVLALGLNEAAYMAEIVRGGLLAVDPGQTEAARALGMRQMSSLWRIVIPQALRVIVPPTGNQVISMLKASSLVSVISTPELLYSVQLIYNNNFKTIPLLIVACAWYLIITSLLYIGQYYIERRFARGSRAALPPTPFQRLRAVLAKSPTSNMTFKRAEND